MNKHNYNHNYSTWEGKSWEGTQKNTKERNIHNYQLQKTEEYTMEQNINISSQNRDREDRAHRKDQRAILDKTPHMP